MTAMKYIT